MADRPSFYRMLTAPYGGLRDQRMIDWEPSQTPVVDQVGPFPAPHLAEIGYLVPGLGSGFRRDVPPDKQIFAYDQTLPLRDFESLGSRWLILDAARSVLERIANDAIDLAAPEVYVRRGKEDVAIPQRWLCDVIGFEDAVDEAASSLQWDPSSRHYGIGSKFVFKRDLPATLHLFRIWKDPGVIACSPTLHDALKGANLTGLAFEKF